MINSLQLPEWFEHYLQAGSDSISPVELANLVHSCHVKVRLRVAENRKTPHASLQILAIDECSEVRLAIATNSATPPDLVWRLAKDDDPTVRYGLAEDANAPLAILEDLASDENPYVCARAIKTIKALAALERGLPCHPRFIPEITRKASSSEEAVS